MKIYLSGQITDNPNHREDFAYHQQRFEERGDEVINPSLICQNMPESTTWEEYMEICLVLLKQADVICMVGDYGRSRGALFEREYARVFNIPEIN